MEALMFALNVLKVALGLGFVIFLHELGHFLLAKWNGVKVEKFSIGFGPTLASYRPGVGFRVGAGSRAPGPGDPPGWGETEYILAALPLGGYVKMLGESQEEQVEGSERSDDPRAYHNKSVWARMQIITAGVIMNLILGVACFAVVASQGGEELPAWAGSVVPGSPAYKAGLRAGDRVVAIDGRRDVAWKNLMQKVSLSSNGQKVRFTVKPAGSDTERDFLIEPTRDEGNLTPVIGIRPASGLELVPGAPFEPPPGQAGPQDAPTFRDGDRVVAVGPVDGPLEPVVDHLDFVRKSAALRDRPMVVEYEHEAPKASPDAGPSPAPKAPAKAPTRARFTIPVHRVLGLGLEMTPGPVAAIRPDSPASRAGLKEGDRIVGVDGKDFDPIRLPEIVRAAAGKPMALTVERPGAKQVEVTATPDDSPAWSDESLASKLLDIPGLGLAIAIEPQVRSVKPGSPASKAGIKPGDAIRAVILTEATTGKKAARPQTLDLDGKQASWAKALALLQSVPMKSVELRVNRAEKPVAVTPEAVEGWFHPSRGLQFLPVTVKTPPTGLVDSLHQGFDETRENVEAIFRIFRSLAQRRVGGDALGGAIPIAQIAYSTASAGWIPFLHFLGILSVNLAVLNFLPIPPLDGGQFAFLAAEKVRGKPLPDSFINVLTIGGLIFVLLLILVINGKDIYQLVLSYL